MPFDAETYTPSPLAPRFQQRARRLAAKLRSLEPGEYKWTDPSACVIGWSRRTGGPLAWLTPGRYLGFNLLQTLSVYFGSIGACSCDTPRRAAAVLERWADTGKLTHNPPPHHYRNDTLVA